MRHAGGVGVARKAQRVLVSWVSASVCVRVCVRVTHAVSASCTHSRSPAPTHVVLAPFGASADQA